MPGETDLIERRRQEWAGITPPLSVFVILVPTSIDLATIQPNIASWHAPVFATTRGTVLGQADFVLYFKSPPDCRSVKDGALVSIERDEWRKLKMEEQFDAVLYLGPLPSLTTRGVSAALCSDPGVHAHVFTMSGVFTQPPERTPRDGIVLDDPDGCRLPFVSAFREFYGLVTPRPSVRCGRSASTIKVRIKVGVDA